MTSQFEGGAPTPTDYGNVNDLLLTLIELLSYTELLKGYQIGKIPTYMEETHVLLHTPIIIINFS